MKRFLTRAALVLGSLVFSILPVHGQTVTSRSPVAQVRQFRLDSTNSQTPPVIDFRQTGINSHKFLWNTYGTVSAGACRMEQSADGATGWTQLIVAQTVTSSGGPTGFAANVINYGRVFCTTPIAGTGYVNITLVGDVDVQAVTFSGATVGIDQATLHANEMVCKSGCAGGTTDTDDGSVANGQSTGLQIALNYMWNGSTWQQVAGGANGAKVDPSGVTSPVSVASLPLPAGAATAANQTTQNTNTAPLVASGAGGYVRQDSTATIAKETGGNLATIAGAISAAKMQTTIAAITAPVNALQTAANSDTVACATDTGCQVAPSQASYTDKSGTVATGGTSQTLAATNSSRKRIIIENPCNATQENIGTAESLFINFTSAASTSATGSSFEISPCGIYDSGIGPVTTEAITVTAATSSHSFRAKEQ